MAVVPAERTCRIRNIPAFKVGFWNGLYHSPAMVAELAENFRRFSDYQPFGSVNHEDVLAAGQVTGVRFDGRTLFIDLAKIPVSIGAAWNGKQLHSPSIEYWDTVNDERARLMAGFRLGDGRPPGLVLRSVTLCGNQAPAVKTLGPMPQAEFEDESYTVPSSLAPRHEVPERRPVRQFQDLAPATRRFTSEDFMDPQAMIASIKAAMPQLSDDFLATQSPEQLAALLDSVQGASAANTVDDATPGAGAGAGGAPDPTAAMGGIPGQMPPMDPTKMMQDCGGDPVKMADAVGKLFNAAKVHYDGARKLNDEMKALRDEAAKGTAGLRDDRIKAFMDSVSTRIPPIQRAFIESSLRRCNSTTVRKFSDGSKNGTELDEEMAKIVKAFPVNPLFIRKFNDGTAVEIGQHGAGEKMLNTLRLCSMTPELGATGERLKKLTAA